MQRVAVITYRCFGTTYRRIFKGVKIFDDGNDKLYRNVAKELQLPAAY